MKEYLNPKTLPKKPKVKPVRIDHEYDHPTGGVRPMNLEGLAWDDKYRLNVGMTDEERKWRAQFLKDQILAADEPIKVPGWNEARYNPLKRFFNAPTTWLWRKTVPYIGEIRAGNSRIAVRIVTYWTMAMLGIYYFFRYDNGRRWDYNVLGLMPGLGKPRLYPGDPGYSERRETPKQYWGDLGFNVDVLQNPELRARIRDPLAKRDHEM